MDWGLRFLLRPGLTDALDGVLARVLKQRTVLGQYLDPIADKLLLSTLFLVLMYKGLMPTTVTVLVFGRDVGILLVAAVLYAVVGRREFGPSIFGKANTVGAGDGGGSCAAAPAYDREVGCNLAPRGARCDGCTNRGFRPALRLDRIASQQRTKQWTRRKVIRTPGRRSVLNILDC